MLPNGTHHRVQPVPPGRTEMFGQANLVNEGIARFKNGTGLKSRIGPYQECNQAGDDGRVAGGHQVQLSVSRLGMEPNLGLAALDLVVVRSELLREFGKPAAEVDDVLVAIHPVVEELEFLNNLPVHLLNRLHAPPGLPTLGFYPVATQPLIADGQSSKAGTAVPAVSGSMGFPPSRWFLLRDGRASARVVPCDSLPRLS